MIIVLCAVTLTGCKQDSKENAVAPVELQKESSGEKTLPITNSAPATTNAPVNGYDEGAEIRFAISNASLFKAPPEGWRIECSADGLFAPSRQLYGGSWSSWAMRHTVKSNHIEAVVESWKLKYWNQHWPHKSNETDTEIPGFPNPFENHVWTPCD